MQFHSEEEKGSVHHLELTLVALELDEALTGNCLVHSFSLATFFSKFGSQGDHTLVINNFKHAFGLPFFSRTFIEFVVNLHQILKCNVVFFVQLCCLVYHI